MSDDATKSEMPAVPAPERPERTARLRLRNDLPLPGVLSPSEDRGPRQTWDSDRRSFVAIP